MLDNPLVEVQEVLKKARHDERTPPTLQDINNVVDQQAEAIPLDPTNGQNTVQEDAVPIQNGHHNNELSQNGHQNGYYTDSNGAADNHEQITVNGAFDLEQVPDQFMADDIPDTDILLPDIINEPLEASPDDTVEPEEPQTAGVSEQNETPLEQKAETLAEPQDLV